MIDDEAGWVIRLGEQWRRREDGTVWRVVRRRISGDRLRLVELVDADGETLTTAEHSVLLWGEWERA